MKYKELKNKSVNELQRLLTESRDKLRELRFKVASDQLKNVREVRGIKKLISRIMFLLGQKSKVKAETETVKNVNEPKKEEVKKDK